MPGLFNSIDEEKKTTGGGVFSSLPAFKPSGTLDFMKPKTQFDTDKIVPTSPKILTGAERAAARPDFNLLRAGDETTTGFERQTKPNLLSSRLGSGITSAGTGLIGAAQGITGALEQTAKLPAQRKAGLFDNLQGQTGFERSLGTTTPVSVAPQPTSKLFNVLGKAGDVTEAFAQRQREAFVPKTIAGEKIGQAIESVPQTGLALATGGALLPLMGVTAGGQSFREGQKRGGSIQQSLSSAVPGGLIEVAMESVAFGPLEDAVKRGLKVASQPFIEGLTEGLTELGQQIVDKGVYGDNLDIKQVGEAALVGVLMAVMLGGAGKASRSFNTVINKVNNGQAITEADVKAVQTEAGISDSELKQMLQKSTLKADPNAPTIQTQEPLMDSPFGKPAESQVPKATFEDYSATQVPFKADRIEGMTIDEVSKLSEEDYKAIMTKPTQAEALTSLRNKLSSIIDNTDTPLKPLPQQENISKLTTPQKNIIARKMEADGATRFEISEYLEGLEEKATTQQEAVIEQPTAPTQTLQPQTDTITQPTAQKGLKATPTVVAQAEVSAEQRSKEAQLKRAKEAFNQAESNRVGAWYVEQARGKVSRLEYELQQIKKTPLKPLLQPTEKAKPVVDKKVKTSEASMSDDGFSLTMTLEELMNEDTDAEVEVPVAKGEPIDIDTRVLTELPKKIAPSISEKAERVYQEIVSSNIPLERIGGEAEIQGSNINRLQGTVEYNIAGKQTSFDNKEVGKSVVDIFSDIDSANKKNLFKYALSKHNIDRWKQNKPVFGETIDDTISAEKVQEYEQSNPEFKQKQQEITKYFDNLMNEWSVKSGLVSQETADMLKERYPNYVPTYRAKDFPKNMLSGNNNVAQIIKAAKGGEDFILPIDQQMIAMTSRTIKNARRNELMNTLAEAYESGDVKAQRYITKITDSSKESVNDFFDIGSRFDTDPVVKGNEYAVNFYTDGKPRQMVVNRTLYKALEQSQSDDGINKAAKIAKKYATNPFKALITGYNPIFGASNIMRDVPTALTYSDDPVAMSKQVPEAIKQMLTNGDKYKLFKAMGGTREGLIGEGKTFKVPNLNETSKTFKTAQKANPIKTIGDVNQFTETLPRFSEFMAVLEKTNNPALALYKSAELTTDFSRHGNLTKLIDSFVPYLNPSVQGIDKHIRSMVKTPMKTIIKGGLFITLPTMLLDLINYDDDDYNELSPRERNLYFNIPFEVKGEKKFLRIPKSRENGVTFSSLYEWVARATRGQEVTGKEMAQAIGENFTPADINSPIWTPAVKAWKQIKEPEAYETNYWGGLIVPTTQRKYSPGEQYDLNSSGIAKAIGKQFELSPFVVDYLIKSYTGIVGQVVQPIGADRKFSKLAPLEKKFITDPVLKSDSINKFYEAMAEAKQEAQDFNKINNVPSKTVTPLEKKANALNKVAGKLSDIRKLQKKLQVQDGTEAKVKSLQKEMNELARKAVK